MQNLLITGVNGFIGKNLFINKDIQRTYNIYGIYNKTKPKNLRNNRSFIKANLLNKNDYLKLPNLCQKIIHLAGDPRTFIGNDKKNLQTLKNLKLTSNILDYAKKSKCNKFIFLSSVYVYSGNKNKIFKESFKLNPIESLGKSKLRSENLIKKFCKKNNISCYILRVFTVYGSYSRKSQFLLSIKNKIDSKKTKKIIIKYPYILRDFIHIDDLIKVINLCLKITKNKINILNVASGKSISIGYVVKKLLQISKKKKELILIKKNLKSTRTGDIDHVANIDKIEQILQWKPKINIHKGLRSFYES